MLTNKEIRARAWKLYTGPAKVFCGLAVLAVIAQIAPQILLSLLPLPEAVLLGLEAVVMILLMPIANAGLTNLARQVWTEERASFASLLTFVRGKKLYLAALQALLPLAAISLLRNLQGSFLSLGAVVSADGTVSYNGGTQLVSIVVLLAILYVTLRLTTVVYLFTQHPELPMREIYAESWTRMKGKVWRAFALDVPPCLIAMAAIFVIVLIAAPILLQNQLLLYPLIVVILALLMPYLELIDAGFSDELLKQ